jgi:two-component system sensor histidine kinase SenX3
LTAAARFQNALRAAQMGIVIVDEAGIEVLANDAASYPADRSAGDAVIGIRLRELITTASATGELAEQEVEVFTPAPRSILLRAVPLYTDSKRHGVVAFAEDMTPRSQVDTIRREFISNASHELRTPLGALRLLAEALVATDNPATRESLGERIQVEATRMTKLVEDNLDLSLIEQHQNVRGVVDICEVIEDAIQQSALAAETLSVPLRADCESVEVIGDHRRLVSAVANIVENALTYTSAKGTEQTAPVVVRGFRDGDAACIEIADQGIGIADRHQSRIFERFYRVEQGRSRNSGGTGLGLAIASHVVQNHHGQIEVESVPGQGSTFRIRLPGRES